MRAHLRSFKNSPARDWLLLFLAIQLFVVPDEGLNPMARWGTMAAVVADGTVRTDHYYQYTIDWARTPDGHYYSNKAPGPALLGLPLFWVMDRVITAGAQTREQRDEKRVVQAHAVLHLISFFTQAVPYALVTLLLVGGLAELGLSLQALHITTVALLFGTTASLFMNAFFGHAMAAMFVMAALLAVWKRWPARAGLCVGLAILCDYGAILLAIPFFFLVLWRRALVNVRQVGLFVAGGLGPAVAWVAYHGFCFGGPLALPNKYQNPAFVDVAKSGPNLWGVFKLFPDPKVLFNLLFRGDRGLAFTQGWVLVSLIAAPLLLWRWRRSTAAGTAIATSAGTTTTTTTSAGTATTTTTTTSAAATPSAALRTFTASVTIFAAAGLFLLLIMNASFGGWNGGSTPGPRYLSPILPVFALLAGIVSSSVPAWLRQTLVVTLLLSVLLFVLVYSTTLLASGDQPLLRYYLQEVVTNDPGRKLERVVYVCAGFLWVSFRAWRGVARERVRLHVT